ncbi:hypothetical protein LJD47_29630, partial [Escherichia coli]|nr:hypothetical protein [Escherichia coli]
MKIVRDASHRIPQAADVPCPCCPVTKYQGSPVRLGDIAIRRSGTLSNPMLIWPDRNWAEEGRIHMAKRKRSTRSPSRSP